MAKRALIFDFDGLIVDSEWPEYLCWQKVFEDHGLALPPQQYVQVVGGATHVDYWQELERRLGRPIEKLDALRAARSEHHRALFAKQGLLPGVQALFDAGRAQGWQIGVASNSEVSWVSRGLKQFGLHGHVSALRCRDTSSQPKPHPAPYLEALEDLGAQAALSFGFEDSSPGVAAAKAAGLTVVAVPNRLTVHQDLSAAHHILESLERFALPMKEA